LFEEISVLELSQNSAQRIMLAALGLAQPDHKKATKKDVLDAIRQMHLLQIDTISVVERSHYFVLWSRLGDYPLAWVDELLAEGQLFEYWSHAACMLPVEDYPLYRHRMRTREHYARWMAEHQDEVEKILAYVRENGPVRSADFERPEGRKGAGWWDWKPEKVTLEILFGAGILAVAKRQGFQRFYDLQERVFPDWDDAKMRAEAEIEPAFVRKATLAMGVAQLPWITNYFYRWQKKNTLTALKGLLESGEIEEVKVEGWDKPGYINRDNLPVVKAIADGKGKFDFERTTLLSPFDPLISDRDRALTLFGFDYKIECYTPEAKRRYGYFTLPVLHKGQLVGRIDAKAYRKEKIFEVKKLHLEPGVAVTDELSQALTETFQKCADWHKTPQVVVRWSDPPELAGIITGMLAGRVETAV
jgi:uncharacterized protein YcaQ